MMDELDRLAWESHAELAPGQDPGPGKAIVFAITKHHAARLAQYLNERHPEPVPDEDPAELIREGLAIEKEITVGLENLLREVEQ